MKNTEDVGIKYAGHIVKSFEDYRDKKGHI